MKGDPFLRLLGAEPRPRDIYKARPAASDPAEDGALPAGSRTVTAPDADIEHCAAWRERLLAALPDGHAALARTAHDWAERIDSAALGALGAAASPQQRRIAAGHLAELGRRARQAGVEGSELEQLIEALGASLHAASAEQRLWIGGAVYGAWDGVACDALSPELGKILRHDIKTPLQAASLNLELLALEQEGQAELLDAIQTIQQSLDSAVGMLQRFDGV